MRTLLQDEVIVPDIVNILGILLRVMHEQHDPLTQSGDSVNIYDILHIVYCIPQ